ncbi:hypothetical protein ACPCBC_27465 [Streptomyces incarnatus]|uniref:hypothetical protein n=1 Tax=Streptomyces sp. WP-1 TaxID=3041497 RepID=UPI00142F0214|nr:MULTISPECIES: hypothetical protein [Streptomyces]WKE72916.1 hypothetical protein QHG49_29865 [Streptomyces sp. WP-1]
MSTPTASAGRVIAAASAANRRGRSSPALAGAGRDEYDPANTPASWEDGRWAS